MLRSMRLIANTRSPVANHIRKNYLSQQFMKATATAGNPQNLPNLPVPSLDNSLTKYLKSIKPFVTDDEYSKTEGLVRKFRLEEGGETLQNYLLERADNCNNWLADWWLEIAYLGFREPLPFFSSPGHVFPLQKFRDEKEQISYIANLIQGAAVYKKLIDSKKLPIDKMGKMELDMNQYNKIFGTIRIPDNCIDRLEYYPCSTYCIVAHKNHFFKMDIFDENGGLLSEKQLENGLNHIIQQSSDCFAPPIGILTADHRDRWADSYKYLIKDSQNRESVSTIQKSLFLICIDELLEIPGLNAQTLASHQCMHGGGSKRNSANRWFDKTVQFIVAPEGIVGLSYEHSPAEGQPIAVMVDFLNNFMSSGQGKKIQNSQSFEKPKYLAFNVDDQLKEQLQISCENVDNYVGDVDFSCFTFDGFGKEFIKKQKMSPDSFIQMAIQYAFYRIHEKPGAHYESAATRIYVDGRTETIRSCSSESIAFAKSMLDCSTSNTERAELLRKAIDGHKKYTMDAIQGFGCDRHLLGLKLAAKKCNMKVPLLFEDVAYVRSTHMRISTSQVATKCDSFMCYGPLTNDGYGCCYNPREETINFACSAFNSNPETSAKKFQTTLDSCLLHMQSILTTSKL